MSESLLSVSHSASQLLKATTTNGVSFKVKFIRSLERIFLTLETSANVSVGQFKDGAY